MAKNANSEAPTTFWLAAAKIFDSLVEKFGWPGVLVMFVMYLVVFHGTEEQRHALIDMYLLGRGITIVYPTIVLGVIFVGTLLAQRHLNLKKLNLMQAEITRLGNEKSALQEAALNVKLHHSRKRGG